MLTSLRIQNFKAWKDTGEIRLAPLTVIFGANSAGKSSLGHLLLALKQTVLSADRRRPLQLGDDNSSIDLGTFAECVYNHDLAQPLSFSLGWRPADRFEVGDPLSLRKYVGSELQIEVSLQADKQEQPQVQQLGYTLGDRKAPALSVSYGRDDKGKWHLETSDYKLLRTHGR